MIRYPACNARHPDKKWGGDECKIERQNNEKLREREESSEDGSFMSEVVHDKVCSWTCELLDMVSFAIWGLVPQYAVT
jgi:hypothetical protein